jgi:cytidylate kinase
MDCRVISISRAMAAGGEEVGRLVAERLGFRYVDDEIVEWAAEKAGVSRASVEKVERTPPLIERILQYLGNAPLEAGHGAYVPTPVDTSQGYEGLIGQVIRETANAGNVVIVAHGASIPLAGMPDLLRVLVTASPEVRAARLAERNRVDQAEARKLVESSDRERRNFLQRFYGIAEELPTHYDLVLNTDVLGPVAAASVIVSAVRGQ